MWRVGCSSAVGSSHLITGTPCQDSYSVDSSDDGSWVAVTVCDGAGSAQYAGDGAQYVSSAFNSKLLGLGEKLRSRAPGGWINDEVIRFVIEVRDGLRSIAKSDDISGYHTTLVSLLVGPFGGLSIHIGDGVVVSGEATHEHDGKWAVNKLTVSEPENGEYANETFFITESTWLKHIRITPLPKINWAILATDGGTEYIWDHVRMSPSASALSQLFDVASDGTARNGNGLSNIDEAIGLYLTDEQFAHVTSDDKTIALVVRGDIARGALRVNLPGPAPITNVFDERDKRDDSPSESEIRASFPWTFLACIRRFWSVLLQSTKRNWRFYLAALLFICLITVVVWLSFRIGFLENLPFWRLEKITDNDALT